ARYQGTDPAQRLKVADIDLLVIGDSQPMGGPHAEKHISASGRYVKLVLDEERRLFGAIVLGYPELMDEVNQLFHERRVIPETFPSLL
ncbi:MAG: hypothetical protein QXJ23_10350, partial [Thermofilum sp.]